MIRRISPREKHGDRSTGVWLRVLLRKTVCRFSSSRPQACVLPGADPPFLPPESADQDERFAYYESASFLADRHLGRANMGFTDGHVESLKPADVSFNNRLWNGCNDPRAKPVLPDAPANWPTGWKRDTP
jgi:prepilin-type processing-associated H-X9-DG protein